MNREDECYEMFLEWRDIETPCPSCNGSGIKTYGSTATWRGGVGGQMLTNGVCDKCWGSGDANKPLPNLRINEPRKRYQKLFDTIYVELCHKLDYLMIDPREFDMIGVNITIDARAKSTIPHAIQFDITFKD